MDTLARVVEGMRVIDHRGALVGKVKEVRFGDPDAVTAAGQPRGPRLHSDLPPNEAALLQRVGYLRISNGIFARDTYVSPDEIIGVQGELVQLADPDE